MRWKSTVPFRPGVQSRVTAKKTDRFKMHHKSKENFSAFSESKFSKIVNTRSKWYSTTPLLLIRI
jgi:hypothetical protein